MASMLLRSCGKAWVRTPKEEMSGESAGLWHSPCNGKRLTELRFSYQCIWGAPSRRCDTVQSGRIRSTPRRNVPLPSSGLKSKEATRKQCSLKMETACPSEVSANNNQTIRHHILEETTLNILHYSSISHLSQISAKIMIRNKIIYMVLSLQYFNCFHENL
jgi:hypothetical protein